MLASLAGLGCAAGELTSSHHLGVPSPRTRSAAEALTAKGPAAREASRPDHAASAAKTVALETTSPRAEGAAFLTPRASEAREEDRTAAILNETARCPVEMALIDGRVCVDRWEGSIVERVPGGVERPWSPFQPVDGHELLVRAVSRPGVVPQGYISGKQAQMACLASGKRLCTGEEWEHACRGTASTPFPYGKERRAGACNDDSRQAHPVPEVGALLGLTPASLWHQGMNQPLINQLADTLLPTGERAECTNDFGVFDMVGNLHEWIDDPHGTFRGGYYMDTSHNGEGCAYATTAHDFTYHDYSTGFRCCADPERVE